MVKLTKLNGEPILINSGQIEFVETIPESKIVMVDGRNYLVSENLDEIVQRIVEYNADILATADIKKKLTEGAEY